MLLSSVLAVIALSARIVTSMVRTHVTLLPCRLVNCSLTCALTWRAPASWSLCSAQFQRVSVQSLYEEEERE